MKSLCCLHQLCLSTFTQTHQVPGAVGCFTDKNGFRSHWPSEWSEVNIVHKEMIPILLAVAYWGPSWSECILCHSDNVAVVYAINKGSAHDPQLMHILCSLIFFNTANNVSITTSHIPGALNSSADALFCNNISFLFSQPTGNPIPHSTVPGSAQSGAHEVPALDIIGLDQAVRRYFDQSITQSTRASYNSAYHK